MLHSFVHSRCCSPHFWPELWREGGPDPWRGLARASLFLGWEAVSLSRERNAGANVEMNENSSIRYDCEGGGKAIDALLVEHP